YVDAQVPDLSFKAFHARQVPQMRIVGSNFPLAKQTTVLPPEAGVAGGAPPVSTNPKYVVIAPADVFANAEESAPVLQRLPAGSSITLVRTEAGWSLVARDGRLIGYVAASKLAPLN